MHKPPSHCSSLVTEEGWMQTNQRADAACLPACLPTAGGPQAGLEIDRVPLPLKSLTIEAASRLAGLPADPAERDPHRREEAADPQIRSALLLYLPARGEAVQ